MSKDGWKKLPTDILRIVFRYFKEDILYHRNWNSLAQSEFHDCIAIKEYRKFNRLIKSSNYTNDLVHHIICDNLNPDESRDFVTKFFHEIAFYFTKVKSVGHNFRCEDLVWRVVESKFIKGKCF